ncbi:hypothetical protein VM1G_11689 [Cytospora mali]|uniref:Uncharacterized protein n=1 Tax=Cytospora mali TaxID=578113 RepID=A0A194W0U2_CYTMA|nr:hypothetical protein VM1G_11689 [Valsa mali]
MCMFQSQSSGSSSVSSGLVPPSKGNEVMPMGLIQSTKGSQIVGSNEHGSVEAWASAADGRLLGYFRHMNPSSQPLGVTDPKSLQLSSHDILEIWGRPPAGLKLR